MILMKTCAPMNIKGQDSVKKKHVGLSVASSERFGSDMHHAKIEIGRKDFVLISISEKACNTFARRN